ncbi:DUF1804 family protein [Burkholderia orbicola]|uniref:DUF1804 family protein n=1 Tax=Burkholderia orbicola TaxID=2978683 RepID=UPI002FE03031
MAHPKSVRDKVRHAYVYRLLSLEVAAMSAGVSLENYAKQAHEWKFLPNGNRKNSVCTAASLPNAPRIFFSSAM